MAGLFHSMQAIPAHPMHAGYSSSCAGWRRKGWITICHCKAHTGHVACGLAQLAQHRPKSSTCPKSSSMRAAPGIHPTYNWRRSAANGAEHHSSGTLPLTFVPRKLLQRAKGFAGCIKSCIQTSIFCGRRSNSSLAAQPEGGLGGRSCNAVASPATMPKPVQPSCMGGTAHNSCLAYQTPGQHSHQPPKPNNWAALLTESSS